MNGIIKTKRKGNLKMENNKEPIVEATVIKRSKGQPVQKRKFKGKASDVQKKVYDAVTFLPFWDTEIKWRFK